jgi:hypothetical protein
VLQRLPPPHTIATDAANPVAGSSCARIAGTHTAAPISESSPRLSRTPDDNRGHALPHAPGPRRVPLVRTAYNIAAADPQPKGLPHFVRRVARR